MTKPQHQTLNTPKMAHKLPKGLRSLCITARSGLRAISFTQPITYSQSRRTLDHAESLCRCQSCRWFPFHHRRSGLNGVAKATIHPREYLNLNPASFNPKAFQWEGTKPGRETLHMVAFPSNTACVTPRSHQWEGTITGRRCPCEVALFNNIACMSSRSHQWEEIHDLKDGCLRGKEVSPTANNSLYTHRRQGGQNHSRSPFFTRLIPTTPSPFIDRTHRRGGKTGVMPRGGTHIRMASNARPAGSAWATGNSRSDKSRNGGNSNGASGSGDSGKGGGNVHEDDESSEATAEQKPGRGKKEGEATTEEIIASIDKARLPLEGRGWTFWL